MDDWRGYMLFYRLIEQAVAHAPVRYDNIIYSYNQYSGKNLYSKRGKIGHCFYQKTGILN